MQRDNYRKLICRPPRDVRSRGFLTSRRVDFSSYTNSVSLSAQSCYFMFIFQFVKIVPRAPLVSTQQTIEIPVSEGIALPSQGQQPMSSPPPQTPPRSDAQAQPAATIVQQSSALPVPRVQDELRLTTAQLTTVQALFQGANCLSRPEKATILSFVGGSRGKH